MSTRARVRLIHTSRELNTEFQRVKIAVRVKFDARTPQAESVPSILVTLSGICTNERSTGDNRLQAL